MITLVANASGGQRCYEKLRGRSKLASSADT